MSGYWGRTVMRMAERYFLLFVDFSIEVFLLLYYLYIKRRTGIAFPLPRPGASRKQCGRAWWFQHHTRPDPQHWSNQCHRLTIPLSCPRLPRERPRPIPSVAALRIVATLPDMPRINGIMPGRERRTGARSLTAASKSSSASAISSASSCSSPTIYFERGRNPW